MSDCTYQCLLSFLKTPAGGHLSQSDIAHRLNIDPSLVSKCIKHNKKFSSINSENFIEAFFSRDQKKRTKALYSFLKENNRLSSKAKEIYKKCITENETPTENNVTIFLKELLQEAQIAQEKSPQNSFFQFSPFIPQNLENFIGRENLLEEIEKRLSQKHLAIICGIGGMGKSLTAIKYAKDTLANGKYRQLQIVYFKDNLKKTLLTLPLKYPANTWPQSTPEQINQSYNELVRGLKKLPEPALIIIDNVDTTKSLIQRPEDHAALEALRQCSKLDLLITSRNTKLYSEEYCIAIKPLNPEDQLKLFQQNYLSIEQRDKAIPSKQIHEYQEILKRVSGHTMVIELLAKTMAEDALSPKEMLEKLGPGTESQELPPVEISKDNDVAQENLYACIIRLFNIRGLDSQDQNLLRELSFLDVRGIRLAFFRRFLVSKEEWLKVKQLIGQSWISRRHINWDHTQDRIYLHPVIRTVCEKSSPIVREKCHEFLKKVIAAAQSKDEAITPGDKNDACAILIYASHLLQTEFTFNDADILLDMTRIIYERANDYLLAISNYQMAIKLYKEGNTDSGLVSEKLVIAYNQLANLLRKNGNYPESDKTFQKALQMMKVYTVSPGLKAEVLNNLGILYLNKKDYPQARKYYQKAKDLREKYLPDDLLNLAYSYHNLGTVDQRQQNYASAIKWHTKALDLRKKEKVPNTLLAESLTMIGNDYAEKAFAEKIDASKSKEDFAKATEYVEKGLALREKEYDPKHLKLAWSYQSRGNIYFYQGKYQEALMDYQQCLTIRKSHRDLALPYTAEALVCLGKTYLALHEPNSAKKEFQHALAIQEKLHLPSQEETRHMIQQIK